MVEDPGLHCEDNSQKQLSESDRKRALQKLVQV